MRAVLVLVLLTAVGAAMLAWHGANSEGSARALEAPPRVARSDEPRASGERLLEPGRESLSLPGKPEAADAAPPRPHDDQTPGSADAGSDWAKLYAGWSTPRLDARWLELEASFHAEVERLCEQRFEAGMYRTVSGLEIAGDDSSYDVLANQGAQGEILRTRAVPLAALDPASESGEDDEARLEYQVVSLPQDVYVELYRRRSELEWLRATLAARVQAGEDPP